MLGQEAGGASEMYLESHRPFIRKRHNMYLQQKETSKEKILEFVRGFLVATGIHVLKGMAKPPWS